MWGRAAIKLYVSNSGERINVQASPTDTIASLIHRLAEETKIPTHAQILLTSDGSTLNPEDRVGNYPQLRDPKAVVYLFDRNYIFRSPSPKQVKVAVGINPPKILTECLAAIEPRSSDHSSSQELLERFKIQFDGHCKQAREFERCCTESKMDVVRILQELEVHLGSLDAAFYNLMNHRGSMVKMFDEFFSEFTAIVKESSTLFDNFEYDLGELRNVELHPALRIGNKTTLLDMQPEGRLRETLGKCRSWRDRLEKSVVELRAEFDEIREEVKKEEGQLKRVDLSWLKSAVEDVHQDAIYCHSLYKQVYDNFHKWLPAVLAEYPVDTKQLHGRDENQCRNLKGAQDRSRRTLDTVHRAHDLRPKIRAHFYNKLRVISKLQTKIRGCSKKLALYRQGSISLQQKCREFWKIKKLPDIYSSCVYETRRRITFQKQFMELISDFQSKLECAHTEEARRRWEFAKGFRGYLKLDFFPFLKSPPPRVIFPDKKFEKFPPMEPLEDTKSAVIVQDDSAEIKALKAELEQLKTQLQSTVKENKILRDEKESNSVLQQSKVVTPIKVINPASEEQAAERLRTLQRENKSLEAKLEMISQGMNKREEELQHKVEELREIQKNNAHLEVYVDKVKTEKKSMQTELENMSVKIVLLLKENRKLKAKEDRESMWKEQSNMRISFKSFQLHDIALFLERKGVYVAFNQDCPNRFLAPECQSVLKTKPLSVLGKIVQIRKGKVEPNRKNLYKLAMGTDYYELIVEFLQPVENH